MKPTTVLLVTTAILLSYSITTGHPHEETSVEEDDDGRRNFAHAHASAVASYPYRPGPSPVGPNFGPTPLPNPLPPGPAMGECYSCTDCPKVLLNTTVRMCGFSAPRCVVYSEKYNHLSKPLYIRGCVSERGSCEDIKRSHEGHQNVLKLVSCHECQGDKCNTNGVPRQMPDITTALFFIIVIPVFKKYALS